MLKEKQEYKNLFGDFWFETPIYHFNFDNSLRFELLDKHPNEEEKILIFLKNLFNDLFTHEQLYLIGGYSKSEKHIKSLDDYGIEAKFYFNYHYETKLPQLFDKTIDEIDVEPDGNINIYKIQKNKFSIFNLFCWIFKGGLVDYPFVIIADAKNKVFMNIYDWRGVDVVIHDKNLLRKVYAKYSDWILEFNREEIDKKLKLT